MKTAWKKILTACVTAVVAVGAIFGLTACSVKDVEKITEKGYFVCGVTVAEPMNFKDASDQWTGFDTEFAQAVAKKLGLEVQFKEIEWAQKYTELNSGAIDCIWNGFTANCKDDDGIERSEKVSLSYFYMNNEQCIVTKTSNVANLTSAASLAGKKAGVEGGSAGAAYAGEVGAKIEVNKNSQIETLVDLKSGAVDFVVFDKTLAKSVIGKGDYSDLSIVEAIQIEGEKYAIGFRKKSDFTAKVNAAMVELAKDGTLRTLAEKYGVANVLDTSFAD